MAKAKKLPSGSWRTLVYSGKDAQGRRTYQSFTADTKAESEFLAAEFKHKHKTQFQPRKMTVGKAIDQYIASKENILSPATIREYKRMRKSFLPNLMDTYLIELTNEQIQLAVNQEAINLSPKTIANHLGLLSASMAAYHPDFRIKVTLPQKEKKAVVIPKKQELLALLEATKGTDMEIAILLAAFMGPRRSEICALNCSDINFANQQISISKAMVLNAENKYVIKGPKSSAGYRTEHIPPYLLQALKRKEGQDGPLINLTPNQITERFSKLRKQLDLPQLTFHKLRHYFASVMHELNIPDKYAMKRMGHATDHMLKNVYQHIMEDKDQQIDQQLNTYFDELMK